MPGYNLFLQLSFAIQKIIQFYSDLTGGRKIENIVQCAPLSPRLLVLYPSIIQIQLSHFIAHNE